MKRKYLFLIIILTVMLGLFASTTETSIESVESADQVIENVIEVEDWMTISFHKLVEEPIELEDWMIKPFVIN